MVKKQITFWLDADVREKFTSLYSTSMSKFFRNCIRLALQDKQFFHDVYFLDNFSEKECDDIKRQDSIF